MPPFLLMFLSNQVQEFEEFNVHASEDCASFQATTAADFSTQSNMYESNKAFGEDGIRDMSLLNKCVDVTAMSSRSVCDKIIDVIFNCCVPAGTHGED